ncbi:uncharacterized protein FPRO_02012 [Fusarium proliferatum ET1]|uniref:Protein kinase domain-containing protein n=1 Tax=Fusarium proliferatum (strain ET1) TaxID=1227346 RepID=A0A1L7UYP2_FUSPR|nr:uncharacterized protein FPRO_02012 [Fusarium proliferatum ET1]CZR32436.1 uncharacterized protein FPRO_02012 [Fusarium proliferatum ET1]
MPLPRDLQGLNIVVLNSISDARYDNSFYNLAPGTETEIKPGSSCVVYAIPYPKRDGEQLACKKMKFSETRRGFLTRVAKTELELLDNIASWYIPFIKAAFYVEGGQSLQQSSPGQDKEDPALYIILEPWAKLSLEDLVNVMLYGEDAKAIAPWDPLGNPDIWPHFIGHCLGFLTTLWIIDPTYLESIINMDFEEAFVRLPRLAVDKFQKVRHKDLKPEHLMLMWNENEGLTPLIIDFGISKIHRAGDPTEHEGSQRYLAPEQIPGNSPSEKSDVFSMACCFTFIEAMLHSGTTGVRQIFEVALSEDRRFRDNIEHINGILNGDPTVQLSPRMEKFRLELRELVESKMLVYNVDDRSNAGEVFEAFIEIHKNYENGT